MDPGRIAEAVKRYHLEDVPFLGRRTQEQNKDVDVVVPERVLAVIDRLLDEAARLRAVATRHGWSAIAARLALEDADERAEDARALLQAAMGGRPR